MNGLSNASSVFAAVSIAIQLGESIKKMVELGKGIKDAPTHIRALSQDLEVLAAVLAQIQQLNGHVAFDNIAEKALQNCQIKILKLQNAIRQAQLNVKSKRRLRRKWGAFSFALNEHEIQSMQISIEEAKSTLQLIQTKSLTYILLLFWSFHHSLIFPSGLVLSTVYNQKETVTSINKLTSLISQSAIQEFEFVTNKMQVDYDVPIHTNSETTNETLLTMNSTNVILEKIFSPSPSADNNGVGDKVIPSQKSSRPFDLLVRNTQTSQQFSLNAALFTVIIQSRTSIVKINRVSEVFETLEADNTIIIYPGVAGQFFGITHGLLISAKATSGWQYSIQPFRAVDENALIFEFCRGGNLDGVRSLFKRNEASPWDRDPKGQTPLFVSRLTTRHMEVTAHFPTLSNIITGSLSISAIGRCEFSSARRR
jgi:hypothetical protein